MKVLISEMWYANITINNTLFQPHKEFQITLFTKVTNQIFIKNCAWAWQIKMA